MKGLLVHVLKPAGFGDCTGAGVSSRCTSAILVGDDVPAVTAPTPGVPVLRLVRRWVGTPREYLHAEPLEQPTDACGPMAGGNFVYSQDSRYREICPYPIPVHDRFERGQS